MRARLWQLYDEVNDSFWLRPALIVMGGVIFAESLIDAERLNILPEGFLGDWIYSGGETGARTLLGAIAGSTIAVAGTVFSITIATLTLASNQMGPRLLRNFTRDRGNQTTLGVYLSTFAYALIVLRSVRGVDQGAFVPHMAITGAIVLALLCVAMLIFFVNHVASRINFDTVIELVYRDLHRGLNQLTTTEELCAPPAAFWADGLTIIDERSGYIQQMDDAEIADWAEKHGVAVRVYARPGDFIFPGAPLATVVPPVADAQDALRSTIALGAYPTASMNVEFAVEQLVDIAVRALSPGVNDPRTAIRVLDRLGAALCGIVSKPLVTGLLERKGRVVFQRNATTYDGLTDAMFHTIRQSANGATSVLTHMADVLVKVAQCERQVERLDAIRRHTALILADGIRTIQNSDDKESLTTRVAHLSAVLDQRRQA